MVSIIFTKLIIVGFNYQFCDMGFCRLCISRVSFFFFFHFLKNIYCLFCVLVACLLSFLLVGWGLFVVFLFDFVFFWLIG